MTKRRRKEQTEKPEAVEPRRHRRLRQREAEIQRRVIIGVGLTIGLVLVLLAYGVLSETVLKPRRPIATVNGEAITVAEFQRRLRAEQDRLSSQINQYIQFSQQFATAGGSNPFLSTIQSLFDQLSTPDRLSLDVLDQMTEEVLIRQLAAEYGVTVTEEEVQLEIERQFGYDRNAVPTPTPEAGATVTDTAPSGSTITAEEFQQRYNQMIATFGERNSITEDEFRLQIAINLMRQKLQEVAPLEYDKTEEQVKARHILIRIEQPEPVVPAKVEADALAKILEARDRILGGEDFAAVAKEISDDPGSAENGGELGWFGRGQMVPEFEDVAFSLEPGEISQPVKTQFGYHLIEVEEKNEAEDQVRARHILVATKAEPDQEAIAKAEEDALAKIEAIRERILAGEDFAEVAKEVSEDTSTAEKGGDLGWFGRGKMVAEFDDVAFSLKPGEVSEPVKTPFGYHLILVEEHDPEHPLDEAELQKRRNAAFDEWLQAQKEAAAIESNWSLDYVPPLAPDLVDYINQLRFALSAPPPQPESPTPADTGQATGQDTGQPQSAAGQDTGQSTDTGQ